MTKTTNAPGLLSGGAVNAARVQPHYSENAMSASNPPDLLTPEHLAHLRQSAISDHVIAERGYETITVKNHLMEFGFTRNQCRVPTLLMPVWSIAGDVATYQHRPDRPRVVDGKPLKYETPAKSGVALDVHPLAVEDARRPNKPLIVTEGIKKADAALSAGLCCVALLGVWNWRGRNEHGGVSTLPDWEMVAFKHADGTPRDVTICFDSDVMMKRPVHAAMERLAAFLRSRGASVTFVYLPDGPGGAKIGLDDYLAAGHTAADLLALRTPTLRTPPDDETQRPHPYRETPAGLVWDKPAGEGTMAVRLANFNARIVAEHAMDDGVTRTLHYQIRATLPNDAARETDVAADRFDALHWVSGLGLDFNVEPGQNTRDRLRHAIKTLSGDAERRTVYTHTGWAKHNGRWIYIHAGGAVGAEPGTVAVQLPPALDRYALPNGPDPDPAASVAATVRFARLYPPATFPLVAAVFRAVLGAAEYSLYLSGETSAFKSSVAAVAQQHFGPDMADTTTLPANWSSTANALEMLAFHCADAVLTIDEAVADGPRFERDKLVAAQQRVLRAQGNQSGRARMTADGRIRPEHPPRGLIVSTGEQPPVGHSLRARMLLLELRRGNVPPGELDACQTDGAAGLYARTLAGYIAAIGGDLEARRADHAARAKTWRAAFKSVGGHDRTPPMLADLMAAFGGFTAWAVSIGALAEPEAAALMNECRAALMEAGAEQGRALRDAEPTGRFLDLITTALATGRAHLLDAGTGDLPQTNPQSAGWRRNDAGAFSGWRPGGAHIGWVDAGGVYLLRDAAHQIAQSLARDTGHELPWDGPTLARRLRDRDRLAAWDERRGKLAVRKSFPNAGRVDVLHVREWRDGDVCASSERDASYVYVKPAQPAQPAQLDPPHAQIGPVPWAGLIADTPKPAQGTGPNPAQSTLTSPPAGPVGPVGPVSQPYIGPRATGDAHTRDTHPNGNGRERGEI